MTAEITKQERALIDAAIAEGRVRKIETGASAYPPLKWCEKRNGIYAYMQGKAPRLKVGYLSDSRMDKLEKEITARRAIVLEMSLAGESLDAMAKRTGYSKTAIKRDRAVLRQRGLLA